MFILAVEKRMEYRQLWRLPMSHHWKMGKKQKCLVCRNVHVYRKDSKKKKTNKGIEMSNNRAPYLLRVYR